MQRGIVDYNRLCELEPALISIWDFPIGTDLQLIDDGDGVKIIDNASGRQIPPENFYVPPSNRG